MTEVVAVATAIVGALCGVIAKLYRDRGAERARADELKEQLHREHKRDLKRIAGLPTSLDPPAPSAERIEIRGLPSPLVRDESPKPPRPRKKPRS